MLCICEDDNRNVLKLSVVHMHECHTLCDTSMRYMLAHAYINPMVTLGCPSYSLLILLLECVVHEKKILSVGS